MQMLSVVFDSVCINPQIPIQRKGRMEMTAEQSVGNDNRILKLLELLTKNQMNAQTEQIKQMCGYVETLEQGV